MEYHPTSDNLDAKGAEGIAKEPQRKLSFATFAEDSALFAFKSLP